MTRIVLVRHGETEWHTDNRYAGRTDVALTPLGHRQAETLAGWATAADLDAIWCSPLSRARDTAAVVASATGHELRIDDRLVELDFGDAEGLTADDMSSRFPDRLAAFRADPVAHHLPGGEDPNEAVLRAVAVTTDITGAHPDGRVLVVAHTTLIRLLLCHLMGVETREYRRVFPFVRNGAITEIGLRGGVTSLIQFNAPPETVAPAPVERAGGRKVEAR